MTARRLQSVERSTLFSRLDFRAKFAVFVATTSVAALWSAPLWSLALTATTLVACLWVGVPRAYLGFMLRVMTPFVLIMLFTHGLFNVQHVLRLTGAEAVTPWWTLPEILPVIGGRSLSVEGLSYGAAVGAKSLTFLLLVPLCVFTTDPNAMVLGLVRLRVPYKLAFVFSSTLRFFPLIFDEINAVMETQRLRGFALEDLNLFERVRIYSRVAVPVILGALYKAQQIEVVLQSKAFSGRPDRTYRHATAIRPADGVAVVAAAVALIAVITLYTTLGWGRYTG